MPLCVCVCVCVCVCEAFSQINRSITTFLLLLLLSLSLCLSNTHTHGPRGDAIFHLQRSRAGRELPSNRSPGEGPRRPSWIWSVRCEKWANDTCLGECICLCLRCVCVCECVCYGSLYWQPNYFPPSPRSLSSLLADTRLF